MGAPARPGVPFSRPYTGMNGIAPGILGGTAQWILEARRASMGALWNNGAFGVREMRGKKQISVHATGRAVDLSYRRRQHHPNVPSGRAAVTDWLDRVILHANTLGIEILIDYFPKPHGRAWRCDRQKWLVYRTKTVSGAPGGDWFHVEINPAFARSARTVRKAWAEVFPEIHRDR